MNRREPTHIDTAAVFVQHRLRGTLLEGSEMDVMGAPERLRSRLRGAASPQAQSKDPWERIYTWRRVPIRVHNARLLDPPATLESHGFELVRAGRAADKRQGIGGQLKAYRIESRRIVEALTGCGESWVVNQVHRGGFHGLRMGDPLESGVAGVGTVAIHVRQVHTDVSPWVELWSEWNEFVKGRHGAIFNVWRSTDPAGPVEEMPLAVCSANSVVQSDMVATLAPGLLPGGEGFVSYHLAHAASQQWFYYPRMTADEALVMRFYDTREPQGGRRGVFHVAVKDPGTPAEARRRESVDIRVAAAFGEETERDARRARFLAELPPIPDAPGFSAGMPGA